MIESIRAYQSYICGLEQVKLYIFSDVPLVSVDVVIVINKLFNRKKKKEQEALLKDQSITSENLISWFLQGGRSKGQFSRTI